MDKNHQYPELFTAIWQNKTWKIVNYYCAQKHQLASVVLPVAVPLIQCFGWSSMYSAYVHINWLYQEPRPSGWIECHGMAHWVNIG